MMKLLSSPPSTPVKPMDSTTARFSFSLEAGIVGECAVIVVSILLLCFASMYIDNKQPVPTILRLFAWLTIPYSLLAPLFLRRWTPIRGKTAHVTHSKLLSVSLALSVPFFMLSISYEAAFFVCIAFTMYVWVLLEQSESLPADSLPVGFKQLKGIYQKKLFRLFFSLLWILYYWFSYI